MDTSELRDRLREIDKRGDQSWLATVDERKQVEATFHDDKVDRQGLARNSEALPERQRGNQRFYTTVNRSRTHTLEWIERHASGHVVLDYACGQGELAMHAARSGAELAIGIDISSLSIDNARTDAVADGLTNNTFFFQGDCEATGLPDNSVDVMICSGMLHHLNVELAFPEMLRILKPGGVCLAIEALDYNPLFKAYRLLTPELRTEWEKHHILSHRELNQAKQMFTVQNVKYWHLCSLAATAFRNTPLFQSALACGNLLDEVVLKLPLIQRLAWQFSFELHAPSNAGSADGREDLPSAHAA